MRVFRTGLSIALVCTLPWSIGADEDHHHVLDTSEESMKAIAKSLGVECTHCHIEKTPDGKPHFEAPSVFKDTAIHMKIHFVDSLRTSGGEAVECATCHAGTARFLPRGTEKPASRLMEGVERKDIMRVMKGFTKALDVKCQFCHEKNDKGRMDPTIPTSHRTIARFMFENFTQFQRINDSAVNCASCHQGKTEFLPRSVDEADESE